jgi:hypothetical protein
MAEDVDGHRPVFALANRYVAVIVERGPEGRGGGDQRVRGSQRSILPNLRMPETLLPKPAVAARRVEEGDRQAEIERQR